MTGTISTNLRIEKTMHVLVKDYMDSKDPKNPDAFKVVNVTLYPDGSYEFDDEQSFRELNDTFEHTVQLFEYCPDLFNEDSLSFHFCSNINTGLELPEYCCEYDEDNLKSMLKSRGR